MKNLLELSVSVCLLSSSQMRFCQSRYSTMQSQFTLPWWLTLGLLSRCLKCRCKTEESMKLFQNQSGSSGLCFTFYWKAWCRSWKIRTVKIRKLHVFFSHLYVRSSWTSVDRVAPAPPLIFETVSLWSPERRTASSCVKLFLTLTSWRNCPIWLSRAGPFFGTFFF